MVENNIINLARKAQDGTMQTPKMCLQDIPILARG